MPNSTQRSGRIERLVIVGGGTAGWMAAIFLNRRMRRTGGEVILIESPAIGTIGVGEATIPSLVHFIRLLQLDESAFMRRCSATYKLGIRFDDWARPGATYWHPFGLIGGRINGLDLFHFWLKRLQETGSKGAYTDYSVQRLIAEQEKSPWPYGGSSPIAETGSYAFHLDAGAFGDYLREIATTEGVQHLFGEVRDAVLDDQGNIGSVDVGGERSIAGDLFIDATGFRARLIEQVCGDPWIDWSNFMLCDRAVAMPLARSDRFPPYTLSTAMPSGWVWRIPLSSRTGSGYVFSSAHIAPEAATDALIARSGLRGTRGADPRLLSFKIGRRTRFWVRNCVSVGLASGFVEPLESTGIHLIQRSIMLLADYFPDRQINSALQQAYNSRMSALYDEIRDFIMLHYVLTRREEPFWRDARNVALPDTLQETLALYEECGRIENARLQLFPEPSYFSILTGNGRLPRRLLPEAEAAPAAKIWHVLDGIGEQNRNFAARLPTHAVYLTELHRKPLS